MTVCKMFRDGSELHMVVAMSDDRLFQNWYSVIEDDAGIQHPSSTAGYPRLGCPSVCGELRGGSVPLHRYSEKGRR